MKQFGVKIGVASGFNYFFGELSAISRKPNKFSLIAGENLLLYRYPTQNVLMAWPLET
jgi:hypothetical protein